MNYTIEIIAFNLEACSIIQAAGAHRIELCANPADGGTTPSYGMIKSAREKVTIDLFPIIRPRGGDFLYSDEEIIIMANDIKQCKALGCDGVVIGLLQKDGSIDVEKTKRLVEIAYPMDVTFHRAFDHCKNPFEALDQIIEAGCQRILTSGQQQLAMDGADLLAQLVQAADERIIIMPGSGVRADNIATLAEKTGAVEFHSSLRENAGSKMEFLHPAFASDDNQYATVNGESIKALIAALNKSSAG